MPPKLRRRDSLKAFAGIFGASLLTGCILDSEPYPGDLEIRNRDDTDHTVMVTLEKISEDDSEAFGPESTVTPQSTPLWTREDQFSIDANGRILRKEYITEPGAFFVRAQLETGTIDHGWIGLYSASGGLAEQYMSISILNGNSMLVAGQQVGP